MINYNDLYGNDTEKMDSVDVYEQNQIYFTNLALGQMGSNF